VVDGLRVEGPVQKDNGGPVKGFSITREKNAANGGARTSGSCPRNDGGLVEIRRGKKNVQLCQDGNRVGDRESDRELLP
jgi:hypothetical protein